MTETVQRKRSRIDDVVAIDLEDTVNFQPTPSSQSIRSYASKLKNVVDCVMAEEDCVYSTGKHGRNVTFSQRVHSVLDSEWKHAVVIKLLGKPNSVNTFDWLRRKWLTKGGWQLVDLPYDFFIVKFNLEEDMNAVLCGGPWIIAGQTLIVRKWSSNFDPETEVIGKMALWGIPASSCVALVEENALASCPKKIQREWNCALCLISTTSEKCLKMHFQGKKHVLKVEVLRGVRQGPISGCKSSPKRKRTNGRVLLGNFNQISRSNLEKWSGILRPIRLCRWKKPQVGWTKLNTDGSVDPGNAGFGGLFRNYKGEPICAFVSKALGGDTFLVELWAIWRGLVLASSLGIKVIWVESDSLSVVKTINREWPCSSMKASSCLNHTWALLKKFDKHRISHSWRETNRAADHLSKMVLSESDVVLWPGDFHDALDKIIKEDADGRIYCRS